MARASAEVVRVRPADEADFAPLWVEARESLGASRDAAERAVREGRLTTALSREDVRVFAARSDGCLVGFAVVAASPLSGMTGIEAVWIEQLYVRDPSRRHGIGQALLAHVTRYADGIGAAQIVSVGRSTDRDGSRWFTRLGFANVATLRTVSPAALAGRVEGTSVASTAVRRRRTLRARGRAAS